MGHRLLPMSRGVVGAGGGWLLAYAAQRCDAYSHSAAVTWCTINLLGWNVSSTIGLIALTIAGLIVGLAAGWLGRLFERRHG